MSTIFSPFKSEFQPGDPEYVQEVIDRLRPSPDSVFEICALEVDPDSTIGKKLSPLKDPTKRHIISGYYDDSQEAAVHAVELTEATGGGLYIIANPINPAIHAPTNDFHVAYTRTKDSEILRRNLFGMDLDPIRPSKTCATDAEKAIALEKGRDCREWLITLGFPVPLFCDSGNGAWHVFRINEPNDSESKKLIHSCLEAVAKRYGDEKLSVDLTVANSSRLMRLFGTKNVKGTDTPERPHRFSRIVEAEEAEWTVVSHELLQKLAATNISTNNQHKSRTKTKSSASHSETKSSPNNQSQGHAETQSTRKKGIILTVEQADKLMSKVAPGVQSKTYEETGRIWVFDCPWDTHSAPDKACVTQRADGEMGASCRVAGCVGKDFYDLIKTHDPELLASISAKDHRDFIKDGCIVRWVESGRDKDSPPVAVRIANFVPDIQGIVVRDDGMKQELSYTIQCTHANGTVFPKFNLSTQDFAEMKWVGDILGSVIVEPYRDANNYLRATTLKIASSLDRRFIYAHTGWKEIAGKWTYLIPTADEGPYEVDLGLKEFNDRYRLPIVADNPKEAMRESLGLLKLGPPNITIPLFAAMYRAPLCEALPFDVTLWLEGRSGTYKSAIAALFLRHFGKFNWRTLPANWNASTVNVLEKFPFTLKDIPLVIDECVTTGLTDKDAKDVRAKVQRLIRNQANQQGRQRMMVNTEYRQTYNPRGVLISTAEEGVVGYSLLARTVVLEIKDGDMNLDLLTAADKQSGPRLSHAMRGYIDFLAPKMNKLPDDLNDNYSGLILKANKDNQHKRIPNTVAQLHIGFVMAMTYAASIGAVTKEEAQKHSEVCWATLIELGKNQARLGEQEKPGRLFLETLNTLLAKKACYMFKVGLGVPSDYQPGFIGWYDNEFLYFLPTAAYQEVQKSCRESGSWFAISDERLISELQSDKIARLGNNEGPTLVKNIGNKQTKRVWQLEIKAVQEMLGEDFSHDPKLYDLSDISATDRDGKNFFDTP